MKLLYVSSNLISHKIDFFNELGKMCDLTVVFELQRKDYKNELLIKNTHFKVKFLKGKHKETKVGFIKFSKLLSKKNYDIFVVDECSDFVGKLTARIFRMKKIPFIMNTDGAFVKTGDSQIKRIKKYFIDRASYWLCSGNYLKYMLTNHGVYADSVFIYPYSSLSKDDILDTPVNDQEKQQLKEELALTASKVVLSAGSFVHEKGFDVLINAWSQCGFSDDYLLIIIGEGKLKEDYTEQIEDLNIKNIKILDNKHKDLLFKYYKVADLFILPTREDIWGLAINEAMACGLPVISTDRCVAAIELIENGKQGFVIPVENWFALAEKMLILLNNREIREYMSNNSLERIKSYTIQNMASKHIDIFKSIE